MSTRTIIKRVFHRLPFKKQFFSFIRFFGIPPHKIYQHLYFKGPIKIPIDKNTSFLIYHYGFEIENELFWKGIHQGWEKISLGIWMKLAKRATVLFDIGANTGVYTLVARTINPSARVLAFEPVRTVFEKLRYNCVLNDFKVDLFEMAVSNQNGSADIYVPTDEHVLSVTVNKNLNDADRPVTRETIQIVTLEKVIEDQGLEKIDLMKIDVETHEVEVLEGLGPYLERFRPSMLIEVLNEEVAAGIEKQVSGLGYLYFNIDENGRVRQVNNLSKSDYYNFLLCDRPTADYLQIIN